MCPPGYEKVKAHEKGDTHVNEYCRKIKVQGRTKTLMSGLYNETRIAGSDAVLGFDTITDSTAQEEIEVPGYCRKKGTKEFWK